MSNQSFDQIVKKDVEDNYERMFKDAKISKKYKEKIRSLIKDLIIYKYRLNSAKSILYPEVQNQGQEVEEESSKA